MPNARPLMIGLWLVCLTSCARRGPSPVFDVRDVTPAFVASVAAVDPSIAADDAGRVAVSWVVQDTSGGGDVYVSVSQDSGLHFAAPIRLNPTPGRVSSYTESRPVLAFGGRGELVVAWAAKRDSGAYADDIVARVSTDGGQSFGAPLYVNDDWSNPQSTYHGFTALAMLPDGRPIVAWLDGRASPGAEEPARAEVFAARLTPGASQWSAATRVAGDACACCRLAISVSDLRVAIAYRGAADDLRDPRLAVSLDGGDSFPIDSLVSRDRWLFDGCPSIGPAVSWRSRDAGRVAWFTDASGGPHADSAAMLGPPTPSGVYVANFALPGGGAGPRRSVLDSLVDASRPLLATLGDAQALGVVARTRADTTRRVFAIRVLGRDDSLGPWAFLGANVRSVALAAGGPTRLWAAWTERSAAPTGVRIARLQVPRPR